MKKTILVVFLCITSSLSIAQSVLYDQSLSQGSGFNGPVYAVAVQDDGNIIVGGQFTNYRGITVSNLVRLFPDGALDNSFNIGLGVTGPVYALHVENTGHVLAGGNFTFFTYNNILRVRADGDVDYGFSNNGNFNGPVYALTTDANGFIYAGGDFSTYNSTAASKLVKLDPSGMLMTGFISALGTGFNNGAVKALAVTASGNVLVGGSFTSFNDLTSVKRLLKLNSLGILDLTFSTNLGLVNGDVHAIAIYSGGDIVVGGSFTQIGVSSLSGIAMVQETGNLLTLVFSQSGSGFDGSVNALAISPSNKIYATGDFNVYNGNAARGVARITANGAFDTEYNVEQGLSGGLTIGKTVALQTDGRLLVGGNFQGFNGVSVGNFARLLRYAITPYVDFVQTADWCQGYSLTFSYGKEGDYDVLNYFEAQLSDANGSFSNPIVIGQDFSPSAIMFASIPQNVPAGNGYRIRVVSTDPAIIGKELGLGGFVIDPVNISAATLQNVTCLGGSDGAISLVASGGGAQPITFDWYELGILSPSISNLSAETYRLLWTTADNMCSAEVEYEITEPSSALSVNADQTDVSCFGADDGSIELDVSGGVPNYSFAWSHGPSAQNVSGLSPGTYDVTVTDDNGCVESLSVSVDGPTEIVLNIQTTPVTCAGGADGTASVSATGGDDDYVYLWSPSGESTSTISGLTANTYQVTVTDDDGCSVIGNAVVSEPLPFLVAIAHSGAITFCEGGSVSLTASSGAVYLWSTGETTQDITVTESDDYTVTVTNGSGCSATSPPLTVTVLPNITENISQTICNGDAFEGYTATGIYTDMFQAVSGCDSTRVLNLTVLPNITENISQTICDGDAFEGYTVTGIYTDVFPAANGCDSTRVLDLTVLPAIDLSVSVEDADCGGATGSITVTATGGIAPYSFDIGLGGQPTGIFADLAAGPYSVAVTDASGCSESINATVGTSGGVTPSVFIVSNDGTTVCAGAAVSFSAFAVNGGNSPSFDWLVNGSAAGTSSVSTFEITGLNNGDLVSCRLTSSEPCASPAVVTSADISMTVIALPATPGAISGDATACAGLPSSYSVPVVANATGYQWTLPIGWTGSSSTNTISVTAGAVGGVISVSALNACGAGQVSTLAVSSVPNELSISGTVTIGGANVNAGWVFTYIEILDELGFYKADSTQIVNGSYQFAQLPNYGVSFILRAVANAGLHPTAIPTFYALDGGGAEAAFHQWNNPDFNCSITATCGDVLVKNFQVLQGGVLDGICSLNGSVSFATQKTASEDPIPGVDVVVEKVPPGNGLTSGVTDDEGRFRFDNMPVTVGAEYRIYVSIPGIPMADTYMLTVNPSDTAIVNLDFFVDLINNVITITNPNGITQSMEEMGELRLMPNPMQEVMTVLLPSRFGRAMAYRITGIDGRVMHQQEVNAEHHFEVGRHGLAAGVYFLEAVNSEGQRAAARMVVQ